VQAATKVAADRKIIAGVTHYCSAVAMGAVDVYHRFGLPVIVWGAVLPDVTYANDYKEVHRVNGTMINQNEVAAQFMTGLKYKTWVIIHDTTDYGKGHNKYFSADVQKLGGTVLGTFGVTADQQDFNAELTKIKELKPEVIYFGGLTPIGVRIRSQMDKLGIVAAFQGTSGIVSDAFIEGLGPLAEGTLAFREGAPAEKLPGGKFFLEQYQKQNYADGPEAYGAFAYAAASLIMDAIEKVGPDRQKVMSELNGTRDHLSIVGKVTFDDHRQNMVPLITKFVVQDGKWMVWEESEFAKGKRKLPRIR
jgi:branched-chain amino acid transport system substrate-binding protein